MTCANKTALKADLRRRSRLCFGTCANCSQTCPARNNTAFKQKAASTSPARNYSAFRQNRTAARRRLGPRPL